MIISETKCPTKLESKQRENRKNVITKTRYELMKYKMK